MVNPSRIAVFTTGRQDWNILLPIASALDADPEFELCLMLGGLHFRTTEPAPTLSGFPVAEIVDSLQACDSPRAVAQSAGWTTSLLAGALERRKVDALLLVGDRTETLAAGLAAACMAIPVIHLHGGEETLGAVDNACRHALSKLATLHFTAHDLARRRVVQMGEDPTRIEVTGAAALDNLTNLKLRDTAALQQTLGRDDLPRPLAPFIYHATTLGDLSPEKEWEIVIAAVERWLAVHPQALLIISQPNADAGGNRLLQMQRDFARRHPNNVQFVTNLPMEAYYNLLSLADLLIGNSSSGIIEAMSFSLPVVNIGDRQANRFRAPNVIDTPLVAGDLDAALARALQPTFRQGLTGQPNPWGDGQAVPRMMAALRRHRATLKPGAVRKTFRLLP